MLELKNIKKSYDGVSSQQEVDELVELLGREEHLHKRIDQLSGGQKQRVPLAHGAHGVISNLNELPALIEKLEETL